MAFSIANYSSRLLKTLTNPLQSISASPSASLSRFFSTKAAGRKTGNAPQQGKFRKQFKGRVNGISHQGNHISFGKYALQVLEAGWITARQLEAGRRAMTRNARGGKFWVRLITDKPVTERPTEVRMGRGKGAVSYRVAVVKPSRILYEMDGVSEPIARSAIAIAASKMPLRTRFITLR